MARRRVRGLGVAGACLAAWAAVGLALALWSWHAHPPRPADPHGYSYWNTPGELRHYATLLAVETLVLYAVLRPWSYRRSWKRALAAAALLTFPLLIAAASALHASPIGALHGLWLLGLWGALLVTAAVSLVAALRARRRGGPRDA